MIEESPIVTDTRRIRCAISKQFNDDANQYIDYLRSQQTQKDLKQNDRNNCQSHITQFVGADLQQVK
jgi:precorrin isomerase